MVKVGIVGGTGYTGVELLRLLALHEQAQVVAITSRAESGRRVDDLYPNLRGLYDLAFTDPDVPTLAACDVVFFATPHNVAMNLVPELLAAGARVIDLSADYRIRDAALWSARGGRLPRCRRRDLRVRHSRSPRCGPDRPLCEQASKDGSAHR